MNNLIVHKNKNPSSTTITVKVDGKFRNDWDHFCITNNINQAQTLKKVLKHLMDTYKEIT